MIIKFFLPVALFMFMVPGTKTFTQDSSSLIITEFMASNSASLADGDGKYSDWIEIHNLTSSALSLAGCYLSDSTDELTKWVFPSVTAAAIAANGYLVVIASGNVEDNETYVDALGYIHTSFKLSADGENVLLTASDGVTVISSYVNFPEQLENVSYGLASDGITIGYFATPTPGKANGTANFGQVADTKFSVGRGFFTDAFTVAVTTETEGATIHYTTDGSTPSTTNGTIYTGPITISTTTVLRAIGYKTGYFSTNIDTQTYFFVASVIAQPATKPNTSWPSPTTSGSTGGGGGPGGGSSSQKMDYGMDTDITNSTTYSSLIDDALLSIPTISIVTDLANLFNSSTGIYMNSSQSGDNWEREASIELIHPDGTKGFQVNAGLRIRGGSTATSSNPKHSFRIIMRDEYGDGELDYPVLGEDGPKKFNKLDFRSAQNFAWHYQSPAYCTFLDDPFSHDTMRDMGHISTEGFFFHLYLDGVYWGLYQIEERPDASFAESYLKDSEEDYDVIKSDEDNGTMYATDGDTNLYTAYFNLVNSGVTTAAAYYKLQGLNPDGVTPNSSYVRYLDSDNLIDYMLIVFFTGAQDMPLGPPGSNSMPRNLYTLINSATPDGFKYIPHDNEWSLMEQNGISYNRVNATVGSSLWTAAKFNPWSLHAKLTSNVEYKIHFADRVHKHFFNEGALTASANVARYQNRIDEINLAVIAESARWGDYQSANDPYTQADWLDNVGWVRNSYLNASPQTRTTVVLNQLTTAGLYPSLAAPEFSQHGGEVDSGFSLTITAAAGTIYYTTDGTDPRQVGGTIQGTALSGSTELSLTLTTSVTVKARAYNNNGTWSALTEADFTVESEPTAVSAWRIY
jgi:hypothetical protein